MLTSYHFTLDKSPPAVKMLAEDFCNLVRRHGYSVKIDEYGVRAQKKGSMIFADRSRFNQDKVLDFHVFSSLWPIHKEGTKLSYVWQLKMFLQQHTGKGA